MIRTKILLILPLIVAVLGQGNSGIRYYGTSNVRIQRPLSQGLFRPRPMLPGRPVSLQPAFATPLEPVAAAAPAIPAAPAVAPVTPETSEVPVVAAYVPSYAPVALPNPGSRRPLFRPLLPPRPIRPLTSPPAIPQPSVEATSQPPVVVVTKSPVQITTQPAVTVEPVVQESPTPESNNEPAGVLVPVTVPISAEELNLAPTVATQYDEAESVPELEPKPAPVSELPLAPVPIVPVYEPDTISQPDLVPVPETVPQPEVAPSPETVPQPELVPAPETVPQPEVAPAPEIVPEPELTPAPETVPQPELAPTPETVPQLELASSPIREREPLPVVRPLLPQPIPAAPVAPIAIAPVAVAPIPIAPVAAALKPVALPPLLPKPKPIREPAFGRHPKPATQPEIYNPTPAYITHSTDTTKAPPVVTTIQSHPVVAKPTGSLKSDFKCNEENGYYPVPNECDTYIECKQKIAMKYWCPDGLHFNPAAKHFEYPCAYPSEVKCMAGAEEQNPKPTDHCPNQYGFYSMHDGDCSKFIMCQEGLATIMNCPMGLVFNPQTSSCDWPANVPQCNPKVFKDVTCPEPPLDEDGQVSDIIYKYRYGQDCKLYVACQKAHPRLLSCERGLSFDDVSQSCIDEDYVTDCKVVNPTPY